MVDIRVRFSKHGAVRYIGHLDVMRYFQKVMRRAGVDIAYTQGFSPHQVMTFAQPLGVGIESDGEYMDIRMNSIESCQALKDAINTHSVPEIQALSVKILPEGSGNAMASVAAAEYEIGFREGRTPECFMCSAEDINNKIAYFLAQDEIILVKEGKAGPRNVDIKDRIFKLSWNEAEQCFDTLLDASSGYNIKPISLMELITGFLNDSLSDNALMIYRADTYTRDANGELMSMDLVGHSD